MKQISRARSHSTEAIMLGPVVPKPINANPRKEFTEVFISLVKNVLKLILMVMVMVMVMVFIYRIFYMHIFKCGLHHYL